MALDCSDPAALAAAAACFCMSEREARAMQTYLLAVIAGGSLDPDVLAAEAAQFRGIRPSDVPGIQAMLLCSIVKALP